MLFLHAEGVLYATQGSSEVTRSYVWAGLLEQWLIPHPEVCIVFLRSAKDAADHQSLKRTLGRLGDRLIDIIDAPDATIAQSVQNWCQHRPELAHVCSLLPDGIGHASSAVIACPPHQGLSAEPVQQALRRWLVNGDDVQ